MTYTKKPSNEKVIEAIQRRHGILSAVARDLGVSRRTVARWVVKYKELQDALKNAREAVVDLAEVKLFQQVQEGNMTAIIFLLKCLGKDRGYIDKQQVEIEHSGKIEVTEKEKKEIEAIAKESKKIGYKNVE